MWFSSLLMIFSVDMKNGNPCDPVDFLCIVKYSGFSDERKYGSAQIIILIFCVLPQNTLGALLPMNGVNMKY
jgi:hypothetical protein